MWPCSERSPTPLESYNKMTKLLAYILIFSLSLNASAWWDTGHKMVCAEAYELLSPSAQKIVDPLVADEGTFARACLWADYIKRERRETGSWHYINLPDSQQNTFETQCPKNGCLIQAFYDQLELLKDPNSDFRVKQEALWFVGHFVGDIHQPMHAGYPKDLGGNRHQLQLEDGTQSNMHKVWDGQIIEYAESKLGKDQFYQGVKQKITMLMKQEHSSQIEVWAQESRNLAMSDSLGYRGQALELASEEYMDQHIEIVQERIALAAIRLNQILSNAFKANE